MAGTTDRKRDALISYRPPAALREEFHRRVETSGLSVGAFITRAVFGQTLPRQSRRPPVEKEMLARLLGNVAAIRDRLEEIARAAKADDAAAVEAARHDIAAIRAAIMELAGRGR